jgi:hypothetical protein
MLSLYFLLLYIFIKFSGADNGRMDLNTNYIGLQVWIESIADSDLKQTNIIG